MSLRWALLLLSALFLGGLTWWELRRRRLDAGAVHERRAAPSALPSAQSQPQPLPQPDAADELPAAPLHSEFAQLPPMRAREPLVGRELPVVEVDLPDDQLPVLEPFVEPPTGEHSGAATPSESDRQALELEEGDTWPELAESAPHAVPTVSAAPVPPVSQAMPDSSPRVAAADAPARTADGAQPQVQWPPEEERRIVALRLVAPPERFAGRSLRQALAAEGFVLGRFDIFHKTDEAQRAIVSAASLTRPGTFDPQTMDSQHFGGLSLFAVLPGPQPLPRAFDELVAAARNLNQRLHGVLQDELGSPLTPARVALMREQLGGGITS